MNIFQELKEKKVLDKDGKVDALGPYGRQKLTGREVSAYFKKNKVRDAKIRKAVEVALDLGGAMSVAQKEIKKFYVLYLCISVTNNTKHCIVCVSYSCIMVRYINKT